MGTISKTLFTIRPLESTGAWHSDYGRYCEYCHFQLDQLHRAVAEVNGMWPGPLSDPIRGEHSPELWRAVRNRDFLSDAVKVFAAMAVEGFLNYYGVVRLGEVDYQAHLERLSLYNKVRELLDITDSLALSQGDNMLNIVSRISDRRNNLVHPKSTEATGANPVSKLGDAIPAAATEAVTDMHSFFVEFARLVPDASYLVAKQCTPGS